MSAEDAENHHNYARQRHIDFNSDDDFEEPIVVARSNLGPSTSSGNNNFVSNNPVVGASTSGSSSNTTRSAMEGDQDIFEEEEEAEPANDDTDTDSERIIVRVRHIPSTSESDNTSETSSTTTTSAYSRSSTSTLSSNGLSENESDARSDAAVSGTNSSEETNSSTSSLGAIELGPVPPVDETGAIELGPVPPVDETGAVGDNVVDVLAPQNSNNNIANIIDLDTPSPPKKRKRLSLEAKKIAGTPKLKSKDSDDIDDEDDGLTCPICLDTWEMSGEHRLASLKCGHLFGDSCIRRWLIESSRQSGQKVCPQCKTKAHPREIRYLYAKRLRAIDRSEEHQLREQLNAERSKLNNLELELATTKMSYAQVTRKLKTLEADNDSLNILLRNGGPSLSYPSNTKHSVMYKLFQDRNIEISRDPGCRVMAYANHLSSLIVSQKSSKSLFTGYGFSFIDTRTFKPANFLYASVKLLRDISLSVDQQMLVAASMEPKVKLFDLRTKQVSATYNTAEKPIWSCAIGRNQSEHYLYLGSQQGSTYVYDMRFPETIVAEHQTEGDMSPVIQVASVPSSDIFPIGGFVLCKLTSVWFFEHTGSTTKATRFPIEGRFISMDFDAVNNNLLVQTRSCLRHPQARYIFGKLNKINDIPLFEIKLTFFASTNSPVMVRCSQIAVEANTLVAAYIQDSKVISLYDVNREQRVQSLPAQDIVYDTCPIYTKEFTYLASLTETKCRLYRLNST